MPILHTAARTETTRSRQLWQIYREPWTIWPIRYRKFLVWPTPSRIIYIKTSQQPVQTGKPDTVSYQSAILQGAIRHPFLCVISRHKKVCTNGLHRMKSGFSSPFDDCVKAARSKKRVGAGGVRGFLSKFRNPGSTFSASVRRFHCFWYKLRIKRKPLRMALNGSMGIFVFNDYPAPFLCSHTWLIMAVHLWLYIL